MKSLLLTVFSFFFIVNAFSQVNLNQGLIGYFPFDGNANDRSGYNNHPTYSSGTLAPDRFGNANQAYRFNGINNRISIPGAAGLKTASAMSVALFFNPENTNLATLVGKIDYFSGDGTQFQVAINWSAYPGVLFGINDPADACGSQINANSSYVNTGGSLAINQWYCLVATYDRGVQKIYLNGLLIQQRKTRFTTQKQCTNSDIQLGAWWYTDRQQFKGKIDDVRIYNRALSQAEVSALCNVDKNTTRKDDPKKLTRKTDNKSVAIPPQIKPTVNAGIAPVQQVIQYLPETPAVLTSRENELVQTITTGANEIEINIYDNGTIDNDTISVYLDKELILSKQRLTAKALSLKVKLDETVSSHELVMVAENLGEIPPNTSLMVVKAGKQQYEIRITSTEQKNAVVVFKYVRP
jgi:hypothetical protein